MKKLTFAFCLMMIFNTVQAEAQQMTADEVAQFVLANYPGDLLQEFREHFTGDIKKGYDYAIADFDKLYNDTFYRWDIHYGHENNLRLGEYLVCHYSAGGHGRMQVYQLVQTGMQLVQSYNDSHEAILGTEYSPPLTLVDMDGDGSPEVGYSYYTWRGVSGGTLYKWHPEERKLKCMVKNSYEGTCEWFEHCNIEFEDLDGDGILEVITHALDYQGAAGWEYLYTQIYRYIPEAKVYMKAEMGVPPDDERLIALLGQHPFAGMYEPQEVPPVEPLIIACPPDTTAECAGEWTQVNIPLATTTGGVEPVTITNSYNSNGPDASGTYPLGETSVLFTATDSAGTKAQCATKVLVQDTTPPALFVPSGRTLFLDEKCSAIFNEMATAEDLCDENPVVSSEPSLPVTLYGVGTQIVKYTAKDSSGNASTGETELLLRDNTPPAVSLAVEKNCLWPPNHEMIDIGLKIEASDNCTADENIKIEIVSVTSDEAEDEPGSGGKVHAPDAIVEGLNVLLRAERSGKGDGRVYRITVRATDEYGNSADATIDVGVPHDMKKKDKGKPLCGAVDSGQKYEIY